jgi:hypothetical protein
MKNITIALLGALLLTFGVSGIAVGQYSYQAGQFGYRVLGQPLAPPPSMFNGGLSTGVTGRFQALGRLNGLGDFAMPWRQPYQSAIGQAIVVSNAPVTLPMQSSGANAQIMPPPVTQMPAVPMGPPLQSPQPGYNAPVPLPEQAAGTTPAAETGRAWNYMTGQSVNRAVSVPAESYVPSPVLSARLTRIARARGMLAGPAIDVYLSGDVALVQGLVRNVANGTVLCNVLGLEPGVSRIDNRLVVQRYGSRTSSTSAGNVPQNAQGYQARTMPAYGP